MGNPLIAAREMSQDPASGWIGQGGEGSVQCSRGIFNHLVKYLTRPFPKCKQSFYRKSLIAPAAAAIGHAEIPSKAPKTSASMTNSQ